MFKEKNTKKRYVTPDYAKDNSTLDARHQTMIQNMTLKQHRLKDLELQKNALSGQLSEIHAQITHMKISGDIESIKYQQAWTSNMVLEDQSRALIAEMADCQTSESEINYYENTGSILFQYYDLLEKQHDDTSSDSLTGTVRLVPPPIRQTKGRKKQAAPPAFTILDALSCTNCAGHYADSNMNTIEDPLPLVDMSKTKTSLVDEYLAVVDANCLRTMEEEALGICPNCGIILACIQQEGAMVCVDCGYQELLLVEQNRPIIRQPNKDASHYSYKRINHFREWCSQVQGKQCTDIPEEIFEMIIQEIKKEKIQDTKKLTYNKMREILKKLKINRYYEHINYIINRINGVPTPHFSPGLEEKLCSMFKEIQGPFLKHCPSSRKNFLSYSYVLNKMVQLLGLTEYQRYFTMLRSRQKLYLQDQIWSKICEELGWPMYPSL